MKPSQMPLPSQRGESGWAPGVQPLKPPTTLTSWALGAHTENATPSVPSLSANLWAPILL